MVDHGERNVAAVAGEVRQMIETKPSAAIDYVAVVDAESLADTTSFERGIPALVALAVRFGSTRLIDNTIIKAR
jgi:pantoate--beta-alanine ligase